MNENDNLSTKLSVIYGKNWNRWMIQMRVLFVDQDVLNLDNVNYVLVALSANTTETHEECST